MESLLFARGEKGRRASHVGYICMVGCGYGYDVGEHDTDFCLYHEPNSRDEKWIFES